MSLTLSIVIAAACVTPRKRRLRFMTASGSASKIAKSEQVYSLLNIASLAKEVTRSDNSS